MNVLVTGGTGFIGKNFVLEFAKKFNLFVPTHAELDILNADAVKSYVQTNSINAVVHMANIGGSRKDRGLTNVFEVNLKMFQNIAALEPILSKIIFLGSGAEYDKSADIKMVKESDFGLKQPQDDYGRVKFECSKIIAGMEKVVNLRCFGVYGIYEDFEVRFISYAILRSLLNLPVIIKQDTIFEYVYVKDLCRIIEHFLNVPAKEKFYNVGTGQPVNLLALAELVKKVTHSNSEIKVLQPGLGKEYTCDAQKLKTELENFSFTSHEQAIGEMARWYKDNLTKLDLENLKLSDPL